MLTQQKSGNKDSCPHTTDVLAGKSQKMNKYPAWHQAGRQMRGTPLQGCSNAPSSAVLRLRATEATINNKTSAFIHCPQIAEPREMLVLGLLSSPQIIRFLQNRAESQARATALGRPSSGSFSLLPHLSNCEQAVPSLVAQTQTPHKLCTSLPFLGGGTGKIITPINSHCTGSPAVSPALALLGWKGEA